LLTCCILLPLVVSTLSWQPWRMGVSNQTSRSILAQRLHTAAALQPAFSPPHLTLSCSVFLLLPALPAAGAAAGAAGGAAGAADLGEDGEEAGADGQRTRSSSMHCMPGSEQPKVGRSGAAEHKRSSTPLTCLSLAVWLCSVCRCLSQSVGRLGRVSFHS